MPSPARTRAAGVPGQRPDAGLVVRVHPGGSRSAEPGPGGVLAPRAGCADPGRARCRAAGGPTASRGGVAAPGGVRSAAERGAVHPVRVRPPARADGARRDHQRRHAVEHPGLPRRGVPAGAPHGPPGGGAADRVFLAHGGGRGVAVVPWAAQWQGAAACVAAIACYGLASPTPGGTWPWAPEGPVAISAAQIAVRGRLSCWPVFK